MNNQTSKLSANDFRALLNDNDGNRAFVEAVISVVERNMLGKKIDSYNVDTISFLAASVASSQYVERHMVGARRANSDFELLKFAVENIAIDGLILEFGVFAGRTINHIASLIPGKKIYGFDSFQGLPENWRPGFTKGTFSRSDLPSVRENVELIVGWFERTLPSFCDLHRNEKAALLHVDCDIYSSTQVVLHSMRNYIAPGTVIVFDEYFNYPGWKQHEFRAFREFVRANRVRYKYIGLVPHHQQVAVRILG